MVAAGSDGGSLEGSYGPTNHEIGGGYLGSKALYRRVL